MFGIILWILMINFSLTLYQPLQVLQQQITLRYYLPNNSYTLNIPISKKIIPSILFCFIETQIKKQIDKNRNLSRYQKCNLLLSNYQYYCIQLSNNDKQFFIYNFTKIILPRSISTTDNFIRSNAFVGNATQSIDNISNSSTKQRKLISGIYQNISVDKQDILFTSRNIIIKNLLNEQKFYHMYTCPNYNITSGECLQYWKQNYVHTFINNQSNSYSGNLILQRKHYCGIYQDGGQLIYNHVFYGGTIRNQSQYMFFAVLSYQSNHSLTLNMWGGISYSYDHANRDMFCYATDGTSFDVLSLIAGPVYKDTAQNIKGTDNVVVVDNTYNNGNQYYMYFIQFYRPYQTNDKVGDESIFRKIYDEFAFAAHFSKSNNIAPSCLQKQYYHNFILGFPADVTVFQKLSWSLCYLFIFIVLSIMLL